MKPGVGRASGASKVTWQTLNGQTKTHAPNPSPTIPHGCGFEWWWSSHSTCQPMPQPKAQPKPHHTS
ncbi:hypothetical protein Hanom_Chr05g00423801 [Helianthus anomalus]